MKELGIFILNHNGENWLKKNLSNIVNHSSNYSIIIIDNNSTDKSIHYVKKYFPNIKTIPHNKNYGYAEGYNRVLLKEFDFKYFLILNNDVKVTEGWINAMMEIIKNKNIGIVQPKIINAKNKNKFDYAGAAGGFIDTLGIPFCRGRILNNIERDSGQYDDNSNIFWASGCCFMIERILFQKLQGFDQDLFMHQEEIDLCWRAQAIRKKISYCFSSKIYHYGGGTLNASNPKKHYYNHRNSLLLIFKNLNTKSLIIILPLRLCIDYFAMIYYFVSGLVYCIYTAPLYLHNLYKPSNKKGIENMKTSFFILAAHISFFLLCPKFLKKRKPINVENVYQGSIILDYYLKGIDKFSSLKNFRAL